MAKKNPILYVVVPCYNETEVLHETAKQLKKALLKLIKSQAIANGSRVMFVDDGSTDETWDTIKDLHQKDEIFTGVSLAHNRGHQNALLAGLMTAKEHADVIVSMDADLQDDVTIMKTMLEKFQEGAEIVYGVRSSRKKDSRFKRWTAEGFYKFMQAMGVEVIFNHADYRLTSKKALNELEKYREVNLFLRGIFPMLGFKTDTVYYERRERFAGTSKYPLGKMLGLAWNGVSSLSIKPLRFVTTIGFIITFVSIAVLIYTVIVKILGMTVSGWAFTTCSIWLVGGIQTLSLGIIGEYIGKIYSEVKARPRYCIEENLEEQKFMRRNSKR